MAIKLTRKPQKFTVDAFFAADLPRKQELIDGVIGPYSRKAKIAMLSNWGADAIVRMTGPDIWREAIAAFEAKQAKAPTD